MVTVPSEYEKITIQKDNVTVTMEYTGINDLDIDAMLTIFKGILQAATYSINGDLVVEEYEEE